MDLVISYLNQFVSLMNEGGIVMWVLFVLNIFLWYALGYRYFALKRGTYGNVRRQVQKHFKRGEEQKMRGLLDYVIVDSINACKEAKNTDPKHCRNFVTDAISPYHVDMQKYAVLIKTIVMLAPLIGLLGTVMGMIETFDALQSSSMFAQGNSISGGISKALFTTELGLVVAVPGLILGKVLDKQADKFELEFEQIKDILSMRVNHEN